MALQTVQVMEVEYRRSSYSGRTLLREYTRLDIENLDGMRIYRRNDYRQVVVCKPIPHRTDRYELVADAYLAPESSEEVVREYVDSTPSIVALLNQCFLETRQARPQRRLQR